MLGLLSELQRLVGWLRAVRTFLDRPPLFVELYDLDTRSGSYPLFFFSARARLIEDDVVVVLFVQSENSSMFLFRVIADICCIMNFVLRFVFFFFPLTYLVSRPNLYPG